MKEVIAVVGAGTAGLCTAIALTQKGYRTTVFEKHVAPTTRGAGLLIQPAGLRALRELGVGDEFRNGSTPISRLLGENHRRRRIVDVVYREDEARAVSRSALSKMLWDKAKSTGVELCCGRAVSDITVTASGVELHSTGSPAAFDAVVVADGANSTLRAKAGLGISSTAYPWGALWGLFDVQDWAYPDTLMQRYRGTRQMFGLMPTATVDRTTTLSFFWSLKLTQLEAWNVMDISTFRESLIELWPESAPVVEQLNSHAQLALAQYQHAWPKRLGVPHVYVAGDSAHSMSPSLGLGSTLAAQDALAIAESFSQYGPRRGPVEYSNSRLRRIQAYQWLSRLLTPCFQGDTGGWLRDAAFGLGATLGPTRWLMRRSLVT